MTLQFNVMKINDIAAFGNIHSRISGDSKQVYFIRCTGTGNDLIGDIKALDAKLSSEPSYIYRRITSFPAVTDRDKIELYTQKYNMIMSGEEGAYIANVDSPDINREIGEHCKELCRIFKENHSHYNETIGRNFGISLLYMADTVLTPFLMDEKKHKKLVCSGKTGVKEYLLCCLAAMLGIDVLLLLPSGDITLADKILEKSHLIDLGNLSDIVIPEFAPTVTPTKEQNHAPKESAPQPQATPQPSRNTESSAPKEKRELSPEELAGLAESVVMISVKNSLGITIGTGSGIIISNDGYILTNCHVASKGKIFSVRLENDSNEYTTTEIIKYHPMLDLAVIRINKQAKALKFYSDDKELARGQKVIAIGSPLGLFNSVSDGIISGFRQFDEMDMIQFTAPISNGSSGGAVLNMYGEVIGISTAGFDRGQNINLAVSYKQILPFIYNFI